MVDIGMAHQPPEAVPQEERDAPQGMISGTEGGHSISLHSLARDGATLLGRLSAIEGRALRIGDQLTENVAVGDMGVAKLYAGLEQFIAKTGIDVPQAEPDPADQPFDGLEEMAAIRSVDLDEAGIRSVIWATGFTGDYSYLDAELLDEQGMPRHEHGVVTVPGLYCLGMKWLRTRISGLIPGASGDAEHIAERIAERTAAAGAE
jgi:putative flavoprotein involved in K+ transport